MPPRDSRTVSDVRRDRKPRPSRMAQSDRVKYELPKQRELQTFVGQALVNDDPDRDAEVRVLGREGARALEEARFRLRRNIEATLVPRLEAAKPRGEYPIRRQPGYVGERPVGLELTDPYVDPSEILADRAAGRTLRGYRPFYQSSTPPRQQTAPEILADRAMQQLDPYVDQAAKYAGRPVRGARSVGRAFLPLTVAEKSLDPALVALDIATMIPWFRGGRALTAAGKAGSGADPWLMESERRLLAIAERAEKNLAPGERLAPEHKAILDLARGRGAKRRALTEAYRQPGPVDRAVGKAATRAFEVGKRVTQIPSARSRSGRALALLADNLMTEGMTQRRAGRETRYSIEHKQRLLNADLRELKKVGRKLNDEQEYVLRVISDGIGPKERAARHIEWAKEADNELEAIFHGIQADLSERTGKYLELVNEPKRGLVPALRADAPEKLRRAWELFQKVGENRETLLKDLGRLSDEQIAARVNGIARVYRGARWRTYESEVRRQLEEHPARQQYFAALDVMVPNEVQRNAKKVVFDAAIRSAAERSGNPMAVKEILDKLEAVRTGGTAPPPGALLQPSWNEIPPEGTGRGGPKNLGDLEQNRSNMANAATLEWSFREYDDSALEEIATKYGFTPDELRAYTAKHGERITGRVLSNREVWKEGDPTYDVPRGVQATLGKSGGHTWNSDLTSFEGKSGFSVGISKDRGATFPVSDFNEAAVTAFRKLNGDVFDADPSRKVGSWRKGDTVYLDISAVVDNPKVALEIARRENQLEVYDFATGKSLTLEDLAKLVPPPERLAQGDVRPLTPDLIRGAAKATNMPLRANLMTMANALEKRTITEEQFVRWTQEKIDAKGFLGEQLDPSDIRVLQSLLRSQGDLESDVLRGLGGLPTREHPRGLEQRGGMLDIVSPYGVKGSISFSDDKAIIDLFESADITTFSHELAHFIRRFAVSDEEARLIATWAGAKDGWTREAEEKFARGIEQFIRTGQGPTGLKQAFSSLAPAFREIYEQADLPDVPPHVAKFFERLFQHERLRGGRLFGAEDVVAGFMRAPMWRGMPVKITEPQAAMNAYILRTISLFGGGGRRAVTGRGPDDIALRKSLTGSLLRSGYFRREVIGPMVESAMLANRMSAVPEAHKAMIEASSPIPRDVTDIAVKVDPYIDTPDALKVFWDKIASVEGGQRRLSLRDIDDVNFRLVEAARADIFPEQIEGRPAAEIALEILESQQPIENIVWVPADYLEGTGLLHVPGAQRAYRAGLNKTLRRGIDATGLTWDALNDFQKAMILYFNPAYVPMQLVGNLGMNLMQQGVFMPANLWRSVFLHREMSSLARVRIDEIMGIGAASALQLRTTPGQFIQATVGRVANLAADLVPRRAAFIHEARKAGFKTGQEIEELLDMAVRGNEEAAQLVEHITRLAKRAIVDFDRLSPFERNVVARWIFFYPWLRGATDWSINFIADHPMQAMGIALAAEHMRVEQERQLGDRPQSAQLAVPISTKTLGLKVPGTDLDVGLEQLVGERTWTDEKGNPMVFNLRQAFTGTTPFELAQSVIAFAGGGNKEAAGDVVQSLTPVPYAAGVALYGYDPFIGREVDPGLGRFFSEFGPSGTPLADRIKKLNMSPEERKKFQKRSIYPRERKHEWWRLFGGGLAPTPYNKKIGQRRALNDASLLERRTFDLIENSKGAGLGEPPRDVLEDLEWATRVDEAIERGDSWNERLEAVAGVYDERYPGRNMTGLVKTVSTEGEARVLYEQLRPLLYPRYTEWNRQLDAIIDQRLEAEPVG